MLIKIYCFLVKFQSINSLSRITWSLPYFVIRFYANKSSAAMYTVNYRGLLFGIKSMKAYFGLFSYANSSEDPLMRYCDKCIE